MLIGLSKLMLQHSSAAQATAYTSLTASDPTRHGLKYCLTKLPKEVETLILLETIYSYIYYVDAYKPSLAVCLRLILNYFLRRKSDAENFQTIKILCAINKIVSRWCKRFIGSLTKKEHYKIVYGN